MKTFNSLLFFLLLTSTVSFSQQTPKKLIAASCESRGCTGSEYCSACQNCSGCKHCAKEGGTCGVCAPTPNKLIEVKKTTRTEIKIKKKKTTSKKKK